jgi:hypothetical protein
MTAQIFDLEAARAKRAACPPKATVSVPATPPFRPNSSFPSAGTPTRLSKAIISWYSERRYQTEDAARCDALLAVQQLGRAPRSSALGRGERSYSAR